MKQIANHLFEIVNNFTPKLIAISDENASIKPSPQKWSKKEILGHLIDSASNNQHKFVRSMATKKLEFVGYEQDKWVANQFYNQESWEDLINLWEKFNKHITHLILNVPADTLQNVIFIDGVGPFSLGFIMKDYPEHLKHHLKQIFPEEHELGNTFSNVYGA